VVGQSGPEVPVAKENGTSIKTTVAHAIR